MCPIPVFNLKIYENRPTYEYLLGSSINQFGNDLPKKIDVLRRYYSYGRNISETKKISELLREIKDVYANVGVATKHPEHIRIKLKALVKSAKAIISKRKLSTENQRRKELELFASINSLFDVSAAEFAETVFESPSYTSIDQNENVAQVRKNYDLAFYWMTSEGCYRKGHFYFRMIMIMMMNIQIVV